MSYHANTVPGMEGTFNTAARNSKPPPTNEDKIEGRKEAVLMVVK